MAVFTGSNYKGKSQKERIQEITKQLEAGVIAVFEITKCKLIDSERASMPSLFV